MDENRVSVIIPVYNTEKYLEKCLDSVAGQSYKNMEIILVDDGSQDGSPEICNRYATDDPRILVIHQSNGGLSHARNVGMQKATGEFIMFIDSDDYWRDDSVVQKLMDRVKLTHADVTSFSFAKFEEGKDALTSYFKMNRSMPPHLSRDDQLAFLSEHGLYIASAWNKLIRRSLLNEDMQFHEGVYSEDIDWCARLLIKAKNFDYIHDVLYCYRQHNTSISHSITNKKCLDLANGILACMSLIEQTNGASGVALKSYTAFQYGTFFIVQAQSEQEPENSISQLEDHAWILKYHGNNIKLSCLFIACKIFGFRRVCKMVRKIKR